jgi:hypothetical protein
MRTWLVYLAIYDVLLAPIAFAVGVLRFEPLKFWPALGSFALAAGFVSAGLAALAALLRGFEAEAKLRIFFIEAIITFVAVLSLLPAANGLLDNNRPEVLRAQLDRKVDRKILQRGTGFFYEVEFPALGFRASLKANSPDEWQRAREYDPLLLTLKPGALSIPWIQNVDVIDVHLPRQPASQQ